MLAIRQLPAILRGALLSALVLAISVASATAQSGTDMRTARVGVLAFRGEDVARAQWSPLIDYLGASIEGWKFSLVPVTLVSAPGAISAQQIDFLITNPGHYVTLAQQYELSVLATRERRVDGMGLLRYGTVIFARSDSNIRSLDDLDGKKLAAVSPEAFGGFQLAWHEFQRQQIHPFEDLDTIQFMGFPQDAIVMAVQSGDVQAGVVRSGLLENLAAEKRINMDDFTVLQGNSQLGYPYKVSGALYPEWPFTSLPATEKRLRESVAAALLATQNNGVAEAYSLGDIWSAPLSYEIVRNLITAYQLHNATVGKGFLTNRATLGAIALGAFVALGLALSGIYLLQQRQRDLQPAGVPMPGNKDSEYTKDDLQRFESLTNREREILALICDGQSSKTIAEDLGISPKTVEYHRANLLQKTHAKTSTQLVQLATRIEHDLGYTLGDSSH